MPYDSPATSGSPGAAGSPDRSQFPKVGRFTITSSTQEFFAEGNIVEVSLQGGVASLRVEEPDKRDPTNVEEGKVDGDQLFSRNIRFQGDEKQGFSVVVRITEIDGKKPFLVGVVLLDDGTKPGPVADNAVGVWVAEDEDDRPGLPGTDSNC